MIQGCFVSLDLKNYWHDKDDQDALQFPHCKASKFGRPTILEMLTSARSVHRTFGEIEISINTNEEWQMPTNALSSSDVFQSCHVDLNASQRGGVRVEM